MRKIILLCASGMSTSLMVAKMTKVAKEQNYEVNIESFGLSEASEVGKTADFILLGPQVRFSKSEIEKEFPETPVEVIDMQTYGIMDGEAVINTVKDTLED